MSRNVPAAMFAKACAVSAAAVSATVHAAAVSAATMPAAMFAKASAVFASAVSATMSAAVSAATMPTAAVSAATCAGVCFECEKRHYEEQRSGHASAGCQHRPHSVAGLGAPRRRGRLSLGILPRTKSF
jgi:hypothetical protein